MRHSLVAGLAIARPELRNDVKACLRALPVQVVFDETSELDPRRVKQAGPDLLIVDAEFSRAPVEELLRHVKSVAPDTLIALVHTAAEPDLILRAMRAGADEFIFPPLEAGLRTAFQHLEGKLSRQRQAVSRPVGKVLALVSAKGGCGATTVACHLAAALQQSTTQNILMADLDLGTGMVGFLMNAKTSYSILDAAKNTHRLDVSFWKGLVSNGLPRLDVIPGPSQLSAEEPLAPGQLGEVLRGIRFMYDWIIVDLGRGINEVSATVLEYADELFIVSTIELPALYQARLLLRRLLDLRFPRTQISAIFNRLPRRREFTEDEMRNFIGVPVRAEIHDFAELDEAYTDGKLATPGSDLGKEIAGLAKKILSVPELNLKERGAVFGLRRALS